MASITLFNERPVGPVATWPLQGIQWFAVWLAVVPFTLCLAVLLTSVMVPRNCLLLAQRLFH